MKRLMIVVAAVFLLSISTTNTALACGNATDGWALIDVVCDVGTTVTMEVKGSKSVHLAYNAHGSGRTYSIGSYHAQGNKQFASSSGDQKIFYQDWDGEDDTVEDIPGFPSGTAGADWVASWSSM